MKPAILVVEDELSIATLLHYNLEKEGFAAAIVRDGREALLRIHEQKPDLIVLDWMLPELSGIDLCREIRKDPATKPIPIIMLTAKGEEADKIKAFASGADDYITKPFSPNELIARIRAVLRRAKPGSDGENLTYRDIVLDPTTHRVKRNGRDVHMGPTEFRLLKHFLEHPARVFSREQLLDSVWGQNVYVEVRTVDVHIRRLRKALNEEGEKDFIRTVRSAGYALEDVAE
ncbi:MAG: phosphate regulon transcriptional regulator PhoB [Dongiaceae bacterium]